MVERSEWSARREDRPPTAGMARRPAQWRCKTARGMLQGARSISRLRAFALLASAMLLVGGCGGSSPPPGPRVPDARAGEEVYRAACFACHARDGEGVPGLGKPLANSELIAGMTDDELARFIVVGRGTTDPANTSGIAMPPRGGRPNLSDADVYDVVAYLRTLQDMGS